jgi:quercetin dioxygenase-like cupin family protein
LPRDLTKTNSHIREEINMKPIRASQPASLLRFTLALIAWTTVHGSFGADVPKGANNNSKVTVVYQHELPHAPGKSIKGVLVEYGPGGSSSAHTHAKSVFIYATVLEGAVRSAVNDEPVVTYRTGESFSEMPGDRHRVSENASLTAPAKLLAVFVVDTDEKVLTMSCAK